MRPILLVCTSLLIAQTALAGAAEFVGSATCGKCHQAEYQAWRDSHHDWALRPATAANVLGDFDDAVLEHLGTRSHFSRRDGRFVVETEGPDGELGVFEVAYAVGVEPLQQYLVALDGGRLQALSLAWDTRPAAAGGQRWFHLHQDEAIGPDDPLHWTRLAYNWNSSCAACHSTDLQKNYDPATDRFATSWAEPNVGCEACHGPGSAHVERAGDATGLITSLGRAGEGAWRFAEDASIAHWDGPPRTPDEVGAELKICAPCHARRRPIETGYQPGEPFLDTYMPALLEARLYHPDGQIDDEVYVYGSFLQSRMHRAGVTCSDCHDPHGLELNAPGNALCSQCHRPEVFDTAAHHHHEPGSAGALCSNCHMPATTYMVVDPRHDHSFRVPRPDLSLALGTPNACTGCHGDQSDEWARDAVETWYGPERRRDEHFGSALYAGAQGLPDAERRLAALVGDPDQPAIARASAMALLPAYVSPDSFEAYRVGLADPDPLIRVAAVRALAPFSPQDRVAAAAPLLSDPLRAVRIEAARLLADVPPTALPQAPGAALEAAIAELIAAEMASAEPPESHLNLGVLHLRRGQMAAAEAAYRQAIRLDPYFTPAYVNLADLHRAQGREAEAEALLREAIAVNPEAAAAHHALGLALIRAGRAEEALPTLGRAAELDADHPHYAYVHGIALNENGRAEEALRALARAQARHANDPDLLLALATIHRDQGAVPEARRYAEMLVALRPDDPSARGPLQELRGP